MIFLLTINAIFLLIVAYIIFKVFKLVKFNDPPIFFSIISIFCSLWSKFHSLDSIKYNPFFIVYLGYIIAFLFFLHTPDDSILHTSDILRVLNFTAIMFLVFALVFDLYKWFVKYLLIIVI